MNFISCNVLCVCVYIYHINLVILVSSCLSLLYYHQCMFFFSTHCDSMDTETILLLLLISIHILYPRNIMYEHLFSYRTETIIRHRAANGSKGREIRNEARSNQLMYSVVQKHCEAFIRVPVSSCQFLSDVSFFFVAPFFKIMFSLLLQNFQNYKCPATFLLTSSLVPELSLSVFSYKLFQQRNKKRSKKRVISSADFVLQ